MIALMADETRTVGGLEGRPVRLLIADDDDDLRAALRDLLGDIGFDVCAEARDGLEALAAAKELAPDVVLMDLRMPGMDGLKATAEIRRRYPAVQVVILSAYDDPGLQEDAEEVGAAAFLVKGSTSRTMKQVLESAVAGGRRDSGGG